MKTFFAVAVLLLASGCNPIQLGFPKYRVTVQGTLQNPATAQSTHHAWATTVENTLPHHLAFQGAINPLNGQVDPAQAILIDTWDDSAAMDKFYAASSNTDALGSLFQSGYELIKWQHPADFVEWGAVDVAIASIDPVFLFRIRGTLKATDLDVTRENHNRVAGGESKEQAVSLTDVTHAVQVGVADPQQVLFIDFWQNPQLAGQFFTNEATISGAGEVFAAPGPQPAIFAPASTWAQW